MTHKKYNIQAKPKLYWLDVFLAKPFKVCTDGLLAFSNANLSASVGSGSGISNLRRKAK